MKKLTLVLMMALTLLLGAAPAFAQEDRPVDSDGTVSSEPSTIEPEPYGPIVEQEVATYVNGDRVDSVPAGARATLLVTFMNVGEKTATGVTAKMTDGGGTLAIVDGTATLGDLAKEEKAQGRFVVEVSETNCTGDFAGVVLEINSSLGEQTTKLGFPVLCPGPNLYLQEIKYSGGDGDQSPEPGEKLEVTVTLFNQGRDPATDVRAALTLRSDDVTIVDGTASWPDIPNGKAAANTDPFVIQVAADAKTQDGCEGGPDIMPMPAEDQPLEEQPQEPTAIAPAPPESGEGQTEPGSGSSGSTGTADDTVVTDDPYQRDGGSPPEPVIEQPDPSVAFEALAKVTSAGKTFDIGFGSGVYCAFAEGRPGDKSTAGGTGDGTEPARLDSALRGAREDGAASGSRGGPIAAASLMLVAAMAFLGRTMLQRRAMQ